MPRRAGAATIVAVASTSDSLLSEQALRAIRDMRVDGLAIEIVDALRERGIRSIVLKGPAIRSLLYADGQRSYGDVDLLVAPDAWAAATAALGELGFRRALGGLVHPRMESGVSDAFRRDDDTVDLHVSFYGLEAPPAQVWAVLSRTAVALPLAGKQLEALAPPARALHVVLHAAQHGAQTEKTQEDLRRALAQLPDELWHEALEIATELGALGTLAAGLRLQPAGAELAGRLGVAAVSSVATALRIGGVPLSEGFEELRAADGWRARRTLVVRELFPTADFLRWWSPLARRGAAGLAVVRVWRALWLLGHAPRGYRAWKRAQRQQ